MKLISLNTWAGKLFDPLMEYVSLESSDTDIFCFQEIFDTTTNKKTLDAGQRANLYKELSGALPDHVGRFAPSEQGYGYRGPVSFNLYWGLAMFVKKDVEIKYSGDIFVHGRYSLRGKHHKNSSRNLQYALVNANGINYTIANLHGLWNGKGKTDTEERLEQSSKIKSFLNKAEGKKILSGDFNLLPNTKSLRIMKAGLVDLIEEKDIPTTRSKFYTRSSDKFADYILVSPDVDVKSFEVPNVEVSDHLPMVLKFK
jgi:exonuclease III